MGRSRQVGKDILPVLLVLLVLLAVVPSVWADQKGISGLYRYKTPPYAGMKYEPGDDHYLKIEYGEKLTALYIGANSEAEHGIYYTKTEVLNLVMNQKGDIEFTLGNRDYFTEPFDVKSGFSPRGQRAGGNNIKLFYKGRIEGDKIILTCTSEYHRGIDCWTKDFVFERVKEIH